MNFFVKLVPTFVQNENGDISITKRTIEVVLSEKGNSDYDKVKELQALVANGTDRSLFEVFAPLKCPSFNIMVLCHEEGSFYAENACDKAVNKEKLSEEELSWLPWSTQLGGLERPILGHALIVKDDGKEFLSFTEEEVVEVIDSIMNKNLIQHTH